jgi:Protein of unknown function (DUF4245)
MGHCGDDGLVSQTADDSGAPPHPDPELPAARAGGPKTAQAMVLSLLAVLVLVVGLVLLVPRPNAIVPPAIDVASAAQGARADVAFVPAVPAHLPDGWSSTSARVQRESGQVLTWRVGYTTPSGGYAGYQQAVRPPSNWFKSQSADGAVTGAVTIAGRSWTVWEREDRAITMLVLAGPAVTTIVTGKAPMAELITLAAALPVGGR